MRGVHWCAGMCFEGMCGTCTYGHLSGRAWCSHNTKTGGIRKRRRVVCVVCVCGSSDCGIRESFFESYRASGKIVNRLNKSMMIGNWVWRGSGGERWDSSARRMRSIEINCRDQVLDYLERSYLKVTWDLSGNYLEVICNLSQNSF